MEGGCLRAQIGDFHKVLRGFRRSTEAVGELVKNIGFVLGRFDGGNLLVKVDALGTRPDIAFRQVGIE